MRTSNEVAEATLPGNVKSIPANELTWQDRGRLIAVVTGSAVYVGYLTSMIFHKSGKIHIYVTRLGFDADVAVDAYFDILVSDEREPA